MAKYDEIGDKKPRKFPIALIFMFVGIAVLIAGIILFNVTDMSKYKVSTVEINEDFDGGDISKLNFDYDVGQLTINKSDDDKIHVEGANVPDYVEVDTDGDTLNIISTKSFNWKNGWKWISFNFCEHSDDYHLTVSLPQKIYDDVKLDLGAGQVDVNGLSCKDAKFDFGAGEVNFLDVAVSGKAKFDCGAGQVTLSQCIINEGDFDCGVGEITYNGEILGDTKIDCGVGQCTFNIEGDSDNYKLTGDKHSSPKNDDPIEIDISTGIGDMDVNFI